MAHDFRSLAMWKFSYNTELNLKNKRTYVFKVYSNTIRFSLLQFCTSLLSFCLSAFRVSSFTDLDRSRVVMGCDISRISEALIGVLGIRDNWASYLRDKG